MEKNPKILLEMIPNTPKKIIEKRNSKAKQIQHLNIVNKEQLYQNNINLMYDQNQKQS